MNPDKPIEPQTAYLAGGCFWGMEELLRQIPGVVATEVGYSGGDTLNPVYEQVKTGLTGHAEAIKVTFDPKTLTYRHLLFEFFRMHNPTTRNRQGNDAGSQYRSAIFYLNDEQQRIADEVIATVNASAEWHASVATEVAPFRKFSSAEDYHQDYLLKHPNGYTCHYVRKLGLGEIS
ncbi:MAG: peptide-methionine (S)-S-oxide reductase MsrA [Gallionella sp.]